MKSLNLVKLFVPALILVSTAASAASVVGSKHDLSTGAPSAAFGGAATDQVCVYCHTPHNANLVVSAPLWNKAASGATYNTYTSSTMSSQTPDFTGVSGACLSCHDGTVSTDSFYNPPGSGSTPTAGSVNMTVASSAYLGTDLSNDHPIGIVYATSIADDPTQWQATPVGATLYSGNVECASCHNVHDSQITPFLRVSNAASALCQGCHQK